MKGKGESGFVNPTAFRGRFWSISVSLSQLQSQNATKILGLEAHFRFISKNGKNPGVTVTTDSYGPWSSQARRAVTYRGDRLAMSALGRMK